MPGEDKELDCRSSRAADNSSQGPQLQGKGKFKCTPLLAQGQSQLKVLQHFDRAHVTHHICDKPPSQSLPAVLTWPPRGICVLLSTLGLVILSQARRAEVQSEGLILEHSNRKPQCDTNPLLPAAPATDKILCGIVFTQVSLTEE